MFDSLRTHGLTVRNLGRVVRNSDNARHEAWRAGIFLLADRATPFIGVEHDGARYLLSTYERTGVCFPTFVRGFFEEDLVQSLIAALSTHAGVTTIKGMTVLEVGANIGTETISFLVRHGVEHVIAIEPDAENVRFLRANMALNGVEDRVSVHELALTDDDCEVIFEKSEANWGGHKVHALNSRGLRRDQGSAISQLQGRSLDSLVDKGELAIKDVGLAWIDAELHEAQILDGARSLAAACVPTVTEYNPNGLREIGALDRFHALVAELYGAIVDLREPRTKIAAKRVAECAQRYSREHDYTNLLLLSSG